MLVDIFLSHSTCDSYLNTGGLLTNKVLDNDGIDPSVMALCCMDH